MNRFVRLASASAALTAIFAGAGVSGVVASAGCESSKPERTPSASGQDSDGYPWPGTEHVVQKETERGPLQR